MAFLFNLNSLIFTFAPFEKGTHSPHQPRIISVAVFILCTRKGRSFMLSKVAQVLYPIEILPLRTNQHGWLSKKSNYKIRASITKKHYQQWNTSTGNLNNEIKRHGRYRTRHSKNTRALHRPRKWPGHRLRTPVPFT